MTINLDETKRDHLKTEGSEHLKKIADHYGVFEHLFGDAYFLPRVPLNIFYSFNDLDVPVYNGNTIKPHEADKTPRVEFDSDEKSLWSLILTNPDGHFTEQNSEYVHWFM